MKIALMIILDILWKLIAWFVVIFILPFKHGVEDTNVHNDQPKVTRYKLPAWASWMETKDELLCGDLSIPTVSSLYEKWGSFIASWYWIGVRNTGSILWYVGKEAPNYLACMTPEDMQKYGVYQNIHPFLFLELRVGWNVYRDWYSTFTNNGFWATPYISLRFKTK